MEIIFGILISYDYDNEGDNNDDNGYDDII